MWICPSCSRHFKNTNQHHSCKTVAKKLLFNRRPIYLQDLYELIYCEILRFGEFREEAVPPNVLYYKTRSTFMAIKVKSRWLDIEFFLEEIEDVPPVKRYLQISKNRVVHIVSIDNPKDINQQLINWMLRSYQLIST